MKRSLLLATAVLAAIATVNAVSAAETLRSPKAKALAESVRTVPGNARDVIDQAVQNGSPKGRQFAAELRSVPGGNETVDLVHGPRPSLSPRDPRYETALREQRATTFQVAPLK